MTIKDISMPTEFTASNVLVEEKNPTQKRAGFWIPEIGTKWATWIDLTDQQYAMIEAKKYYTLKLQRGNLKQDERKQDKDPSRIWNWYWVIESISSPAEQTAEQTAVQTGNDLSGTSPFTVIKDAERFSIEHQKALDLAERTVENFEHTADFDKKSQDYKERIFRVLTVANIYCQFFKDGSVPNYKQSEERDGDKS